MLYRGDDTCGRAIGFGFPSRCASPGCAAPIQRSLAQACGGTHGVQGLGTERLSCDEYFCSTHLFFVRSDDFAGFLCRRCAGRFEDRLDEAQQAEFASRDSRTLTGEHRMDALPPERRPIFGRDHMIDRRPSMTSPQPKREPTQMSSSELADAHRGHSFAVERAKDSLKAIEDELDRRGVNQVRGETSLTTKHENSGLLDIKRIRDEMGEAFCRKYAKPGTERFWRSRTLTAEERSAGKGA